MTPEERAKSNAASRAWYHANKERAQATGRAWLAANKPRHRELTYAWRERNPLRSALSHRENGRLRESYFKGIGRRGVYARVLARDGYHCYLCDKAVSPETLTFDHVVPLVRGGAHSEANVKVAHALCNNRKYDKTVAA